jgi:hypothetical protein
MMAQNTRLFKFYLNFVDFFYKIYTSFHLIGKIVGLTMFWAVK